MKEAEVFNDDAEEDMMHTIRTGQIPDQLLQDILEEAGQFMFLFKHNPSSFLTRSATLNKQQKFQQFQYSEKLMTKRRGPFRKKKRPEGIVSLTRPRFGKRSSEVVTNVQSDPGLEHLSPTGSPISRAIYLYLLQNYGIPIENKALRSQSETFSKLTRPRFGKRRFVLELLNAQRVENLVVVKSFQFSMFMEVEMSK